jgi:signal transduction histidine kinase
MLHISASAHNVQELLHSLNSSRKDSLREKCYSDLGSYYKYVNADSSYYYLNLGLTEFSRKNYVSGIAAMNLQLCSVDAFLGDLGMAKKRAEDALELYTSIGNKVGMSFALNQLGSTEGRIGNLEVATRHFISALNIAQQANDSDGKVVTYTNLGMVNTLTNDLKSSLNSYNTALTFIRDTNNVRVLCNLLINIGSVYGRMKNLQKAKEYFVKAKSKSNKHEHVDIYINSSMNLAIVYQNLNDDQLALSYINEALELAVARRLYNEQTQLLVNKASVIGETDALSAVQLLNQAAEIGLRMGNKMVLDDIYFNLVQFNTTLGNYKEVAEVLQQQMGIHDSLFTIGKAREIAKLQSVYELEQSNSHIKELQQNVERQKQKRNILILIVTCLLAFIFFIVKYLRKVRQLYTVVSEQKEALLVSNKTKDKLFSIIGHDLRAPMSNVAMVVDMLDQDTDEETRKYIMDLLKTQTQYTVSTLEALLLWGKSQINENKTNPERFDASVYVIKNIQLLGFAFREKSININNDVHSGRFVTGDHSHFDFVIRNLLSNAVKYSREGGQIDINVSDSANDGFMTFSVTDHGVGISHDKKEQIFEAFGNTTKGTAGEVGTGIGLMLCKEFVNANGGAISVTSVPGSGSTFTFSFPL